MAQYDNSSFLRPAASARTAGAVDQGLRSYMLGVYNYMAAGVALTGLVAYGLHELAFQNGQLTPLGRTIYQTPLHWVVIFAPLAIVFYMGARYHAMSPAWAQGVFWVYAAAVGASISFILTKYTGVSVGRTFFVSAAAFASLSLWGYTTQRDISGWGSFLFMGMIGTLIASAVQMFFPSPALHFAVGIIGLLVFAGYTAYDSQSIKDQYYQVAHDGEMAAKTSVFGALMLYQDFVGIFIYLLQFTGDRD